VPTPVVLKGCRIFAGRYDIGDRHTELSVSYEVEEKDAKNMGSGDTAVSFPGHMKVAASFKAHFAAGAVDPATGKGEPETVASELLGDEVPHAISVSPRKALTGVDGRPALFWSGHALKLTHGGAVGDIWPIEVSHGLGRSRLVRGTFLLGGLRSAPGSGTARRLGAVGPSQRLYACVHVLRLVGTAVTLRVQSDEAAAFGSPADQIVLGPFTSPDDDFEEAAGPMADEWFRVEWSGTFTEVLAVVAVGVAAG